MKVPFLSLFLACFIAACASTGIMPIGKDTYMVSKQSATGFQSAVGVKGEVLAEANEFCAKQGLVMVLVSLNTKDGVPGRRYATAELVFRAVRPEDAENQRPKLERGADSTIEIRNR
jgi:hypothetical protein